MAGEGYFISPSGDILEVSKLHIDEVNNYPSKFGFTKEELHSIYDKYNEPYGHEGKARKEILSKVLSNGWIRIRHYGREDKYFIEVVKYSNKTKEYLQAFAEYLLPATYLQLTENRKDPKVKDKGAKYSEVHISMFQVNSNTEYDYNGEPIGASKQTIGTYTLLDLLKYKHMEKSIAAKLNPILSMKDYNPSFEERISYLISKVKYVIKPKLGT